MVSEAINTPEIIAIATAIVGVLASTIIYLSRMLVKQYERISRIERTVGKYEGKYEGVDYISQIIIEEVRGIASTRDPIAEAERDLDRLRRGEKLIKPKEG